MDGCHAASLVVPGVFKGVLCDASAGVLRDQFDALNDAVDDLQEAERGCHECSHLERSLQEDSVPTLWTCWVGLLKLYWLTLTEDFLLHFEQFHLLTADLCRQPETVQRLVGLRHETLNGFDLHVTNLFSHFQNVCREELNDVIQLCYYAHIWIYSQTHLIKNLWICSGHS